MKAHNLRLDDSVFDTIKAQARYQKRSMNAQLAFMLEEYLRTTGVSLHPQSDTKPAKAVITPDDIEWPDEA
jgi:hypothetical protein